MTRLSTTAMDGSTTTSPVGDHPYDGTSEIVASIRDAFLNMVADGEFEEDPDGDVQDGRLINCTTYHLTAIPYQAFEDFLCAIGIDQALYETGGDAVRRVLGEQS